MKKNSNLTRPRRCIERKSVVCPIQVKKSNPLISLSHYILSLSAQFVFGCSQTLSLSSSTARVKLFFSLSLSLVFHEFLCFKSIFLRLCIEKYFLNLFLMRVCVCLSVS